MRCDECGQEIPPGEEVADTRSEQTGLPSRYSGNTRTVAITVCPACSRKRGFGRLLLRVAVPFAVAIGVLLLMTLLSRK